MIEEIIGTVNYHLRLPKSMQRIHPIFHVSLLELALKNTKNAENIEIEEDENKYEVEQILKHKQVSGKPFYLVK